MSVFESYGLIGLFCICFLSASILPLSSEAVFLFFLHEQQHSFVLILLVASLGNSLGGLLNYSMGFYGNKLWMKRFGSKQRGERFNDWIRRYGAFCGFFSWVPLIGDPLLLALGTVRSKFSATMAWMVLGKVLRYAVLILFFV